MLNKINLIFSMVLYLVLYMAFTIINVPWWNIFFRIYFLICFIICFIKYEGE